MIFVITGNKDLISLPSCLETSSRSNKAYLFFTMIRGDKDLMSLFFVFLNDFRKDGSNYRGSMPTFLNMTGL